MSDEPQSTTTEDDEREEQLESLIAEYIRDSEAGRGPQSQELLKQYPQFASQLKQFFVQRDRLNRLADPIREFGDDLYQSIGPGKQLSYVGNYELLEVVARGGMGVVYKARQSTLGRIVAVKMIVAGRLANEQDVQRFQSEAQAAASLQHPHIVSIHEVGQHEGWHYFSMDYVEGRDLSTILREKLLPAKTAAIFVRQMAEAIHYAHQQGILHRDLKPSNILIDQHNQIHITDFGLAMRVEGDQGLTHTGQILGTPSYMPPEQAQGKRSLIGPASDVYALGAILYECLTGRPPFRAESVIKTIEQVVQAEAAAPRTLNAAIPRDLETICLKCLEKEPHRRYGTAQLLAEDVGRFLRGEPIIARPAHALERSAKWVRRHPMPAAAIFSSVVALLAVVGMGLGFYYNAQLDTANSQLLSSNQQLEDARDTLESRNQQLEFARDTLESSNQQLSLTSAQLERSVNEVRAERALARRHLYASRMALIQVAEKNGETARIVQLLRSVIPESEQQEDLRDFEWNYLWRKYHGEESRLSGHTGPVIAVAFSPDDKWIASGSTDRTVKIWNAITGKELRTLVGHTDRVHEVAFSLDNLQLVSIGADDIVKVWDITTGEGLNQRFRTEVNSSFWAGFGNEPKTRLRIVGNKAICSAYSADRNLSVEAKTTSRNDDHQCTVNVYSKKHVAFDVPTAVTQIAMSRDGTFVAAAGLDRLVRVWNADTGDLVANFHADDAIQSVAFSSDGSRVVAGTENRLLMVWSLPGNELRVLHDAPGRATCVGFGEVGQLITAVCDSSAFVWNSHSGQQVYTSPTGTYDRITLSPIHGWIAGAPLDKLVNVKTSSILQELNGSFEKVSSRKPPRACAVSKDESLVALTDGSNSLAIYDTATGDPVQSIDMPLFASSVAISPDAKLVAAGSGQPSNGEVFFSRGKILVQEIVTGQTVFEENLPLDVWWLSFSPNGELLAAATGMYQNRGTILGKIQVWNTANWEKAFDLQGHRGCLWSVDFNPSGTRLASAGGLRTNNRRLPGEFKIWDIATGEELLSIAAEIGPINGVAFSPDGTHLATAGGDGSVKIWNGTPLAETPAYEPLTED